MKKIWYGFDWLRALMAIAVISIHTRICELSSMFDVNGYRSHRIQFSDVVNFNILHLSVPVFYLISLYLLNEKWVSGNIDLFARLQRLIILYCVWVGIFIFFCYTESHLDMMLPKTGIETVIFVIKGGHSLFYYLFSLIFLTVIAFFVFRFSLMMQWIFLLFSGACLWIFPFYVKTFQSNFFLTAFWNPLNFIPYVFIAALSCRYMKKNWSPAHSIYFRWIIVGVLAVCFITAFCEWLWLRDGSNFIYNGSAFPPYTRISVAAGASCLFLLSFFVHRPPPFVIAYLSKYSLGLYCLHGFVFWYFQKLEKRINFSLSAFVELFVIIVVSLVLSVLLRRVIRHGLI